MTGLRKVATEHIRNRLGSHYREGVNYTVPYNPATLQQLESTETHCDRAQLVTRANSRGLAGEKETDAHLEHIQRLRDEKACQDDWGGRALQGGTVQQQVGWWGGWLIIKNSRLEAIFRGRTHFNFRGFQRFSGGIVHRRWEVVGVKIKRGWGGGRAEGGTKGKVERKN